MMGLFLVFCVRSMNDDELRWSWQYSFSTEQQQCVTELEQLVNVPGQHVAKEEWCPNYIIPSRDPLGTNKNDGAGWRKLRAAICAIIFAVPRPLLQSPEGDYDGAISQSRGLEK